MGISTLARVLESQAALLASGISVSMRVVFIVAAMAVVVMGTAAPERAQGGEPLLLRGSLRRTRDGGNRLRGRAAIKSTRAGIFRLCCALGFELRGAFLLVGEVGLDSGGKVPVAGREVLCSLISKVVCKLKKKNTLSSVKRNGTTNRYLLNRSCCHSHKLAREIIVVSAARHRVGAGTETFGVARNRRLNLGVVGKE